MGNKISGIYSVINMNESHKESQESYLYNLRINPEGTRNTIAEVEGSAWLDMDRRSKEYSVDGAIEVLKKRVFEEEDDDEEDPIVFEIYGSGGVSRWKVRKSGKVLFSAFHDAKKAEKARARGFEIFD